MLSTSRGEPALPAGWSATGISARGAIAGAGGASGPSAVAGGRAPEGVAGVSTDDGTGADLALSSDAPPALTGGSTQAPVVCNASAGGAADATEGWPGSTSSAAAAGFGLGGVVPSAWGAEALLPATSTPVVGALVLDAGKTVAQTGAVTDGDLSTGGVEAGGVAPGTAVAT